MADISDDEVIEKPKRVMSDKQKEALKKGRELAKANREANRPKAVETKVEEPKNEIIAEPPKLKRATKKVKEEVKPPSPEPVVIPAGKRVSRKPKEVREPSPEPIREPSPPAPKKKRTPRQKKTKEQIVQPVEQPLRVQVPPRRTLSFV